MEKAKPPGNAERQERLAAQLRANLKKRKSQARARQEAEKAGEAPDAGPGLRGHTPSATS